MKDIEIASKLRDSNGYESISIGCEMKLEQVALAFFLIIRDEYPLIKGVRNV